MISQEEGVRIAHEECRKRDWTWHDEIHVSSPRFRNIWRIQTNWKALGVNARIDIDKRTGRVLSAGYLPR